MDERELNDKLARAIAHAAPDQLSAIQQGCRDRAGEIPLVPPPPKRRPPYYLAALAVLLVLVVGGSLCYTQLFAVTATLSLDVNPGLQLELNRQGKVLDVESCGDDDDFLDDLELEGLPANVAVETAINAMARQGCLSDVLLLSVDGSDTLIQEMEAAAAQALETAGPEVQLVMQTLTPDRELRELADELDCTLGRAALVRSIQTMYPQMSTQEILAQSVSQLLALVDGTGETEVPMNDDTVTPATNLPVDTPDQTTAPTAPTTQDGSYLTAEEARDIALDSAGVSLDQVYELKVEGELDEYPPCYEVEFKANRTEYQFEIDARDGSILKQEIDRDD